MSKKDIVTPWEVKGDIDYDKLTKEFGIRKLKWNVMSNLIYKYLESLDTRHSGQPDI